MKYILAIAFFLAVINVQGQQPDSVRSFIDSALHIMQRHSVFSKKMNWKAVSMKAHAMAEGARTYKEAGPAIKYAFDALGDKHGWLVLADEEYRNPQFKPDTGRISANIKEAASKGPKVYCAVVGDKYAYVSIPFFGGQTEDLMARFAQRIQDSLCKVVHPGTKGIIIDLRLNAGGNIYPMLAGLSNVLGSGDVSVTRDDNGRVIERTSIDKNRLLQDGQLRTTLGSSCGDLTKIPVVVLIGPVTGSSGEGLAISFIGRKKTMLVGENTAGYTTANNGFLLPGDNNGIVLAENFMTDRYGKSYRENVPPGIKINGGDDFFNHVNDKKIQAALLWLEKQ